MTLSRLRSSQNDQTHRNQRILISSFHCWLNFYDRTKTFHFMNGFFMNGGSAPVALLPRRTIKKTLLNVVKESFLYQWVNPLNERASLTRHSGNHLCVLGKHLLKVSKLKEAKVCKELFEFIQRKI